MCVYVYVCDCVFVFIILLRSVHSQTPSIRINCALLTYTDCVIVDIAFFHYYLKAGWRTTSLALSSSTEQQDERYDDSCLFIFPMTCSCFSSSFIDFIGLAQRLGRRSSLVFFLTHGAHHDGCCALILVEGRKRENITRERTTWKRWQIKHFSYTSVWPSNFWRGELLG